MRLLLLDNYDSFTWNLYHSMAMAHDKIEVYRNDEIDSIQAGSYDAMVISPGPGLPEEAGNLMAIVSELVGKIPILGICLGHQALAMHYGAKLFNLEQVIHGKERLCKVVEEADPIYIDIPERFICGRYHSWIIDPNTLPSSIIVNSVDTQYQIMGFRHVTDPSWGLQYHPESVMTPLGNKIISNWINFIRS